MYVYFFFKNEYSYIFIINVMFLLFNKLVICFICIYECDLYEGLVFLEGRNGGGFFEIIVINSELLCEL